MCGIIGIISRTGNGFYAAEADLLEGLLVLDTLRGMDSTGVMVVMGNRQVAVTKIASHPLHLFRTADWPKLRSMTIQRGRIAIGHNRAATRGSVTSDNAHPFVEEHICLVHNGTLRGDHKKDLADREVDSAAIAAAFAARGAEAVIPEINGAFALAWWDSSTERLHLIRNEERPLCIIKTEKHYVVCSEAWMGLQLLERANTKVEDKIFLTPGMLYSFDIRGNMQTKLIPLRKEPVVTPTNFHPSTMAGVHQQYRGHAAWDDDEWPDNGLDIHGKPFPKGNPDIVITGTPKTVVPTNTALRIVGVPHAAALLTSPNKVQTSNDNYTRGEVVAFELTKIELGKPDIRDFRHRFTGKITSPGKPSDDCTGWMPAAFDMDRGPFYRQQKLTATFTHVLNGVCGDTVFLDDVHIDREVPTWLKNQHIQQLEWDYVVEHCRCGKCQAKIDDVEAPMTSVQKNPGNKLRVICADCVEDQLQGEMKNDFIKLRDSTLQNWVKRSEESGHVHVTTPQSTGSPTVH